MDLLKVLDYKLHCKKKGNVLYSYIVAQFNDVNHMTLKVKTLCCIILIANCSVTES